MKGKHSAPLAALVFGIKRVHPGGALTEKPSQVPVLKQAATCGYFLMVFCGLAV